MQLIETIRSRGPLWLAAHGSLWLFDKVFEFVFYPAAIISFGPIKGIGIMMIASFLVCWGLIYLYDWLSNNVVRDALGFETIKEAAGEIQEWASKKWPFRNWEMVPGGTGFAVFSFLYLSLWHDPMTCLILMRPKDKYTMGKREWSLFLVSVFLSNAAWGLMVWLGVETVEAIFPSLWTRIT